MSDSAKHGDTVVEVTRHPGGVTQIRIGQTPGRVCHAHSGWWGDMGRAVRDFHAALDDEEKRAWKALQEIADARIAVRALEGRDGSAEA